MAISINADLILRNGKIATMGTTGFCNAIAIKGQRLCDYTPMAVLGSQTKMIIRVNIVHSYSHRWLDELKTFLSPTGWTHRECDCSVF
jgi:hypothetical protein